MLENIFNISFTSIRYAIRKIHQKAFKFHATSNCRLRTNMFENITILQSIVITKSTGIFENALNLKHFPRIFSFLRTLFSLVLSIGWQEDVPRIIRFEPVILLVKFSQTKTNTWNSILHALQTLQSACSFSLLIYSLLIATNH